MSSRFPSSFAILTSNLTVLLSLVLWTHATRAADAGGSNASSASFASTAHEARYIADSSNANIGDATTSWPSQSAFKEISAEVLLKYQSISVTVDDNSAKVTYSGVPLRAVLAEMMPGTDLDSMPEWKKLARKALIMEVLGNDGFPGLIATTEIAMNKSGDRFILATHKNGKVIETGVHLICKADEGHVRWVRSVASVRLISVANK
ncbi:MAG TPA: hypothetical protein V6C86_17210 [Oculatellaceae cyanobacterium]